MDTVAPSSSRRMGWKLALVATAMFGFGYLLVPIYRVVCEWTGFNGTTSRIEAVAARATVVDTSRHVIVEFVANTSGNLPWEFRPTVASVRVHPGDIVLTSFHARNIGNAAVIGQAVPSVTPLQAASHFRKLECFCFSRQPLAPGEAKEMPVQFIVDPDLPKNIGTLTLSYTFFSAPDKVAALSAAH